MLVQFPVVSTFIFCSLQLLLNVHNFLLHFSSFWLGFALFLRKFFVFEKFFYFWGIFQFCYYTWHFTPTGVFLQAPITIVFTFFDWSTILCTFIAFHFQLWILVFNFTLTPSFSRDRQLDVIDCTTEIRGLLIFWLSSIWIYIR